MEDLLQVDFKEYLDIGYDSLRNCESMGCNISGICRCSKIDGNSIVINHIIPELFTRVYEVFFDNGLIIQRDYKLRKILFGYGKSLDLYIIDRVLRHYKIYDINSFHFDIIDGYYGEEIGKITIAPDLCELIYNKIVDILSYESLKDRVNSLLVMEYGGLLPEFEGCDYEIIEVNKSDIFFGCDSHYKSVIEEVLDFYSDESYKGIRGVVSFNGSKYRVIDGYHRIHTTKKTSVEVINIIKKEETN